MISASARHGRFFAALHPAVSMAYFVAAIGLTLACFHPVFTLLSLFGAVGFSIMLRGKRHTLATAKFTGPMFLLVALGNPLFNHRGATMLFMLFDQWITFEAIAYGICSACSLSAVIFWFACYQQVMTSDKFLYLFGNVAPNTALIITMTLRFIPKLQQDANAIAAAEAMLNGKPERLTQKLGAAMRRLSTLLTMSMEEAVCTADSMRARGYGEARRTTFHLFRFDTRSALLLAFILACGGVCALARIFGYGHMQFYPRIENFAYGAGGAAMGILFATIMLLGTAMEIKEAIAWRCYGLIK